MVPVETSSLIDAPSASRKRLRTRLLTASMLATFPLAPAFAQSAPGPASSSVAPPKPAVEEVLVTARRRAERIEKVPASITALGASALAQRNVTTQQDLQRAVPGVTIRQTESDNAITYSIRGQTVDAYTGSATAVVPYIDEIQQISQGAGSLFDLSSIQVLKGPQGTLFGRNATGGAVLYTTAPPTDTFGGFYDQKIGNYGLFEEQGALNVPLVPGKALLRVSFDATDRGGYVHNLYDDADQGRITRRSGRVSLTLTPWEDFKNTTVYELDYSGGNSAGDSLYSVNQCGQTYHGIPLACSAAALFSPSLDQAIGLPGAWAAYLKANPKAYPGGITAFLQYMNKLRQGNFWDVDQAQLPFHYGRDYYLANTTSYDVTPELQLKNIFGYSGSNFHDNVSETGNPYGVQFTADLTNGYNGNRVQQNSISDELQAQGKLFDDTLTYIFGAYYQHLDISTFYPQTYFNIPPILNAVGVQSNFYNQDTTEAIFGQATYDLGPLTGVHGLSFTGGYRYTWEQLEENQLPGSDYYGVGESSQHLSFSNPSWTLELSYQADPNLLFYIEGRRSWRSGGINGVGPQINANAAGGGDYFGSEYTRDAEAGMKFGGLVMGHPATFNIAVYNQWIDNVQRAEFPIVNGSSIATTINVPAAEVSGIEADASIRPVDWLQIGASGTLTDPRFTSGNAVVFGNDFVFDSYADTPRASGDIYGTVDLPVAENIGTMSIRGDIYGQTGQFFSNNNFSTIPGTALPGYGLVNMRYDWHAIFGTKLSFAAYVNNLLNKGYYVGGLAQGASLGVNAAALGLPQMFGVEFRYNF